MSLEPEPGVSRWDELDLLFRAGELMGDLKFNTMRAAKDEKDDYEAVKETVSVLRKKGKKEIDDLKKKYFSRSRTEAESELKSLSGDTAYLVELLEEFEQIRADILERLFAGVTEEERSCLKRVMGKIMKNIQAEQEDGT